MVIASASAPAVVPPLGRLHGFHPGWFGAVMGTAVIGVVAYQNPGSVTSLRDAAHAFGAAILYGPPEAVPPHALPCRHGTRADGRGTR